MREMKELPFNPEELAEDKWFFKNALGHIECRLCFTTHTTEGNYMAHKQGKRHQMNLIRKNESAKKLAIAPQKKRIQIQRTTRKIGNPAYKYQKKRDPATGQRILNFVIHYPDISEGIKPRYRIMSTFEQKKEAPNNSFQYLIFAADPYQSICFKIPADEIEEGQSFFNTWDREKRVFTLEFAYKVMPKFRRV